MGNLTVAQANVFLRAKPWEEREKQPCNLPVKSRRGWLVCRGECVPITPPSLGQGFRERPINYLIITSDSYENLSRVVRQFQDEMAKNRDLCGGYRLAPQQARNPWMWTVNALPTAGQREAIARTVQLCWAAGW